VGIQVFAERLKALREEKGISKRGLAAELGMSHVAIFYYERGERVPDIGSLPTRERGLKDKSYTTFILQ
jgi:transcriptional regulator with XRE-family HTH domain